MQPIRWPRVFAVLVVLFGLVEAMSQAFTWVWAGQPYVSFAKYVWSPYGLVRNNPQLTMPGYQINKNGFRNLTDFAQEKPPGTLRVLMLGGSVLYSPLAGKMVRGAERVDSSSTIAQYLEQELAADPDLAGLRIEVINAAVNFNQITEVASAYLVEYAFWDPDVVIVLGSANNFPIRAKQGEVAARRFGMQKPHPWRLEFERVANERSFYAFVEHAVLYGESRLASVAWARKAGSAAIDKLFAMADARALGRKPVPAPEPASFEEFDAYVSEYLGYADAMIDVARRRGQTIAFFWEYFLEHMQGVKTLSPPEQELLHEILRKTWQVDAAFNFHARDLVGAHLESRGVPFLDPLEELRGASGTVFSDYIHYTREGNALMAKFLHRELRSALVARAAAAR
jgi:hypothetical protein